ncbi:MAG: hypothetical protein Q8L88_12150 [Bacteroidota bacterium]|nr:hypothetical protein [Bacteroidota bacterium]
MIGGFGGLLLGGVTTKSIFDFNDNDSSIKGFITVITSSVIGALIGYNNETTLTYSFPHKKNLNGLVSEEIISKKQLLALRTVSW